MNTHWQFPRIFAVIKEICICVTFVSEHAAGWGICVTFVTEHATGRGTCVTFVSEHAAGRDKSVQNIFVKNYTQKLQSYFPSSVAVFNKAFQNGCLFDSSPTSTIHVVQKARDSGSNFFWPNLVSLCDCIVWFFLIMFAFSVCITGYQFWYYQHFSASMLPGNIWCVRANLSEVKHLLVRCIDLKSMRIPLNMFSFFYMKR